MSVMLYGHVEIIYNKFVVLPKDKENILTDDLI